MDAEQYVDELIRAERDEMVERAEWISDHRPQFSVGMALSGGEEARIVFDDAQLCYIHGLFSGTVVLGQSFIERSVCGLAYGAGEFSEDDRPGYHDAVDFLDENDILSPKAVEGVALNKLHELRNPLVHFRKPADESTLLGRKMESVRENPEEIAPTTHEMLKADAEKILKTCFSVSGVFGVGHSVER